MICPREFVDFALYELTGIRSRGHGFKSRLRRSKNLKSDYKKCDCEHEAQNRYKNADEVMEGNEDDS